MKVLEAQSAILTNYEVYEHLNTQNEQRRQLKKDVRKRLQKESREKKKAAGNNGDQAKGEAENVENTVRDFTRRPGNLETVVRELLDYLKEAPSPLGSKPFPYNQNSIKTLLERLRPYDLTKAEILMIMNLRPTNLINLTTLVEEMDLRFTEERQQEMVDIIAEVLGKPDSEANRQAMTENREARKEQSELVNQEGQVEKDMEVDGEL